MKPSMHTSFALASCCILAPSALLAQTPLFSDAPAATKAQESAVAADNSSLAQATPHLHSIIQALPLDTQRFNEHIIVLSSPWMGGRLPGTPGMEFAMDYMEYWLKRAGIEPGVPSSDGSPATFRQAFDLGGRRVAKDQSVSITPTAGAAFSLVPNQDVQISGLGKEGSAEGALAFVGYGIEEGPEGYTSFSADHSLEGKIALCFRFEPMNTEGKSLWSGEGWSAQAGFQGKLAAIAKRKPAAIVVINPPGAADPRATSLNTSGGRAIVDVPVFMMSTDAAERVLAAADSKSRSVMELRQEADKGGASFDLAGATASVAASYEEKKTRAENVIGLLKGRGTLASEYIVIGGHLDHLGNGDFGSREGPGRLHPGADDNASGAAGVMIIADDLAQKYAAAPTDANLRSVLFMGFSAEESGLNGSRHYVEHPLYPIKDTVLMMNFDMIGRMTKDRLSVTGANSAKGMLEWAKPIFDRGECTVVINEAMGSGGSDHASFRAAGVPFLFGIIADFHADYHTSRDVSELIERESGMKAVRLWEDLAWEMAQRPERFVFDDQSGPMRGTQIRVRIGMRTRDAEDGSGLEVSDVTKDSISDKAGVLKGDHVVKFNKISIKTREDLVNELRKLEPKGEVQVVITRAGEEKTLFLKLGDE